MNDQAASRISPALPAMRAFIFDMDGVIYRGEEVIPGAPEFIAGLRRANVPFLYMTNNSTTPAAKVAQRLVRMGIAAEPAEVLTSADVTAALLARELGGGKAIVLGEEGIRSALVAHGFVLTDDHRQADVVVVGLDRELTYARLREAGLAIRRGALFAATNTDRTLPTPVGLVPGAGSIVMAVEAATDVVPRVFGKPSPDMYLYALQQLGTDPAFTAAVGDRPETDIVGGQLAGLATIAVLTGVGTPAMFAALQPPPDWVFPDLYALALAYFAG